MAQTRQPIPEPYLTWINQVALPHGGKTKLAGFIDVNKKTTGVIADSGKASPEHMEKIKEAYEKENANQQAA